MDANYIQEMPETETVRKLTEEHTGYILLFTLREERCYVRHNPIFPGIGQP